MKLTTNQKQPHLKGLLPLKHSLHLFKERKRIADDLHDEIGPMLAALKLRMFMIKEMKSSEEIFLALDAVTSEIDFLIQDVRRIIRNIAPDNLERYGLIKSIENFRSLIQKNNILFDFRFEGAENHLTEEARMNIYRIIMELINNSIKHSQCKIIKLIIKTYLNKTIIIYSDDGCKLNSNLEKQNGMGLKSIKARVDALRGKFIFNNNFQDGAFYEILFDNTILLKK